MRVLWINTDELRPAQNGGSMHAYCVLDDSLLGRRDCGLIRLAGGPAAL